MTEKGCTVLPKEITSPADCTARNTDKKMCSRSHLDHKDPGAPEQGYWRHLGDRARITVLLLLCKPGLLWMAKVGSRATELLIHIKHYSNSL